MIIVKGREERCRVRTMQRKVFSIFQSEEGNEEIISLYQRGGTLRCYKTRR